MTAHDFDVVITDLGMPDKVLNQKLTAWWELDFLAFRAEI